MNRRGFLGALAGAFALDPERLLWVPGAKTISIPAPRRNCLITPEAFAREVLAAYARYARSNYVLRTLQNELDLERARNGRFDLLVSGAVAGAPPAIGEPLRIGHTLTIGVPLFVPGRIFAARSRV